MASPITTRSNSPRRGTSPTTTRPCARRCPQRMRHLGSSSRTGCWANSRRPSIAPTSPWPTRRCRLRGWPNCCGESPMARCRARWRRTSSTSSGRRRRLPSMRSSSAAACGRFPTPARSRSSSTPRSPRTPRSSRNSAAARKGRSIRSSAR